MRIRQPKIARYLYESATSRDKDLLCGLNKRAPCAFYPLALGNHKCRESSDGCWPMQDWRDVKRQQPQ